MTSSPLDYTAHRPFPPPGRPWVMHQRWEDLLFMHWRIPIERMRALVPPPLPLDTFDGSAWIGVVPFRMSDVRPRFVPAIPGLSAFPELNVRTYVSLDGRPGVYFFSLDAANEVAVSVARRALGLPYFRAKMSVMEEAGVIHYRSRRDEPDAPSAELTMRYAPAGEVYRSTPGSLDYWLTERYCLYADHPGGRVTRIDIHHAQWPLQPATAELELHTMLTPLGIAAPTERPLVHFARRLDVLTWLPERVR